MGTQPQSRERQEENERVVIVEPPQQIGKLQAPPKLSECESQPHDGETLTSLDPLCCGCGITWVFFLVGWIISSAWWVGACVGFFVSRRDQRERFGFILNLVMALINTAGSVTIYIIYYHLQLFPHMLERDMRELEAEIEPKLEDP